MSKQENQHQLAPTGERMVSQLIEQSVATEDVYDHLHRYAKSLDFAKGKDVLDIASGEGYGSNLLTQVARSVIGVDISQEAIDFAKQKYQNPKLNFLIGSADAIPIPDHSIDLVVSFETLEHHDKHDEMMAEIKRVLRPGGVMMISTPDRDVYKNKGGINHFHIKELNLLEFKSLVGRYFAFDRYYFQRYIQGSFIISEDGASSFKEFQGGFDMITSSKGLSSPYYNICIASDLPVDADYDSVFHNYKPNMYDAQYVSHVANMERKDVMNSKTYKLGNAIISPLRILKSIFK